jgi:hypothetical protein
LPPPVAGSDSEAAARERQEKAIECINHCLAFAGNLHRAALRCHYVLGYLLFELKTMHGNIRGASSSSVVTFHEFLKRGNLGLSVRFVQTHIKWYSLCSAMPGLTDIAAKGWTEVKLLMMNDVLKTAVTQGAAQAAHSRHGRALSAGPAGRSAADEPMADARAALPRRAEARPASVKGRPSQPSPGDKRSRADQVPQGQRKKQKAESESRFKMRAASPKEKSSNADQQSDSDAEQQEDQEAVESHVEEEAASAALDAEQKSEEEEDQHDGEEEEEQEEDQQQEEEDQQEEEEEKEKEIEEEDQLEEEEEEDQLVEEEEEQEEEE